MPSASTLSKSKVRPRFSFDSAPAIAPPRRSMASELFELRPGTMLRERMSPMLRSSDTTDAFML